MTLTKKAIVGATGLLALGQIANAEQINFSTYVPANEIAVTQGIGPLFEAVAEATGGALTAQIFTAGQMFGPLDTLSGIQSGAVAGGTVFAGFYGNEIPHAAMLEDSVALNLDTIAAQGAAIETYFHDCPGCQTEAEMAGVISLGGHALSPYVLMCTKEVSSVADLAGVRVRGSTGMMNTAIGLLGGNGVNVAFNEISQAFERGNIDCMIGNANWINLFGITELTKTIVTEPKLGIAPTTTFMTIDRSVWDSWSDDIKSAMIAAMPDYIAYGTLGYNVLDDQAISDAQAHGASVVDLGPEYLAMREQLTIAERERILTQARERGVADPEGLLAAYEANYAKWLTISAEVNGDPAAFAEALRREVYNDLSL